MTPTRRIIGAWAATLGVAALAVASVNLPAEPTEAAWTDAEYAAAQLRYEPAEPEESDVPTEPGDSESPAEPGDSESPAEPGDSESPAEPGDSDDAPDPVDPDEPQDEDADSDDDTQSGGDDESADTGDVRYSLTSVTQWGRTPDFCQNFALSNDTAESVEWEHSFDTSQAPFWGWTPYDASGQPRFDPLGDPALGAWVGDFDASTSTWTIRGQDFATVGQAWRGDTRTLEAGQTRSLRFCTDTGSVPYPEVDESLFSWDLDVNNQGWFASLGTTVETDFQTYIPWSITVDLTELVCPDVLDEVIVTWQDDHARPIDESGHRFSYSLPPGTWGDLIKHDVSTQRSIAQLRLDGGRQIGDHLAPNC